MAASAEVGGAVLCGGGSLRMGTDKATLVLGGDAMAVRVARAIEAAGATQVIAVGGDAEQLSALGLHPVADRFPGEGPLGALVTAVAALDTRVTVVAACDLLAPDPATIGRLLEAVRRGAAVAVPVVDGVDQVQLLACDAPTVRPIAGQLFAAGSRSLRSVLDQVATERIEGVDPAAVRDADAPSDLPAARGTGSLERREGA